MMEQKPKTINIAGRKSPKRWGIAVLIPLVLIFIAFCFFGARWKSSLRLQSIIISGNKTLTEQYIKSNARVSIQTCFDSTDLFEYRNNLLSQPFIRTVKVNRWYPDKLSIEIEEREPIASINTGQLRYVDAECVLLPFIETSVPLDLPVICGIEGLQAEKTGTAVSNPELTEAINILQASLSLDTALYHFISEINMNNGNDITLTSSEAGVPINIGRGDIEKKLLTLDTFWNNFVKSENAERLNYIDLRFNDQVVVKWMTENK